MSGDPECVVCEGAGWDWRRAAEDNLQVDDPVDYYRCPCVEVMRLRAAGDALYAVLNGFRSTSASGLDDVNAAWREVRRER